LVKLCFMLRSKVYDYILSISVYVSKYQGQRLELMLNATE